MSILISPTLANLQTPYYALAGTDGGNVSQITAGSNVVLNPSSGEGVVQISLSGVLTAALTTATVTWSGTPYPTTVGTGRTSNAFFPPRTGTYLCETTFSFNVNPESVVNTTGYEFITAGIVNGLGAPVVAGAVSVFPVNMPPTGGNDYSLKSSFVATLNSGLSGGYDLYRIATNSGANLSLGAAGSSVTWNIIQLC